MKKLIAGLIFISIFYFPVNAQDQVIDDNDTSPWATDKGFWIIESNIHDKTQCTVYFYNNEKQLVYKEAIKGKVLNAKRRRIKLKLKKVLEQTVAVYEQMHKATENEKLVASLL
ncbi:MAG: hypothetical protein V4685_03430 [Bacteroidota bacterium]